MLDHIRKNTLLTIMLFTLASLATNCARPISQTINNDDIISAEISPVTNITELIERVSKRQESIRNITTAMRLEGSAHGIRGKETPRILALYQPPDNFVLQMERPVIGSYARLTQDKDQTAIYLIKSGEFFLGSTELFNQQPEKLWGLAPRKMMNLIQVDQMLDKTLQAKSVNVSPPHFWRRSWCVRLKESNGNKITLLLDPDTAQVQRLTWKTPHSKKIRVLFKNYQQHHRAIYPRRFVVKVGKYNLDIFIESIKTNRNIKPQYFSLKAPKHAINLPMSQFLDQIQ